jgi:hypothetical protein
MDFRTRNIELIMHGLMQKNLGNFVGSKWCCHKFCVWVVISPPLTHSFKNGESERSLGLSCELW